MLKKEVSDKLKTVFGFNVDKLIEAIKAEGEVDVELPNVQVFTDDQLTTRDSVKMGEGKTAAEKEVRTNLIKEIGKKLNFEPKSERLGDLVTEIQTKINANGDDKVKTLSEQVNALIADKESLTTTLEQEKSRALNAQFDSEIIGYFPPSRSQDLKDAERLSLIKNEIIFETGADGKRVAKKNGAVVVDDKTKAPLPVDQVVKSYFTERGWDKAPAPGAGGRGGNDNPGGGKSGFKKASEVREQWEKDNPGGNVISTEFMNHLAAAAKDVPDFDMHG